MALVLEPVVSKHDGSITVALCFEHHPCIVIYMLEGQKRKGEVKKLEALSVHQLINNQRNICSGLRTVGRRTAFCDKSTLWGGYWWFFFSFSLFFPPRDYVKTLF